MTYKETIKAYAVYADISYAEAARRADVLKNFIIDTLESGQELNMTGIGRMGLAIKPAGEYRNPMTGEIVHKEAHPVVKTFISTALKDRFKNADFKVEEGE